MAPLDTAGLTRALIEELRPYAAKQLGSIRIDTDDIRKIVDWFDAKASELAEARAALDGIYTYCNDTLSGRADGGPDDRAWQREAVIHARNLARPFARPEIEASIRARTVLSREKEAHRD